MTETANEAPGGQIWDETLRQWVDPNASQSPAELANDLAFRTRYAPIDDSGAPMTYVDGWYHVSTDVTQSTLLASNGIAGFRRMWFPAGFQITKLGVAVTIVGAAGSVIRLGIYDDVKGLPTNALLDAGTQSGTALGVNPVTVSYVIPRSGWYHLVAVPQGAPATNPTLRVGRPTDTMNRFPTTAFIADGNMFQGFYKTGVTGALPSPLGGVAADAGANSFCIVVAGLNP